LNQIIVDEKKVVSIRITDHFDRHAPIVVTYFNSYGKELGGALGHLAPVEREE
jgi:hypothetical protein